MWLGFWFVAQLELDSELESDLRDTVDWGRKWLVDFNARNTRLVSFDRLDNRGAIDVKMDGSVFDEKSSFKTLGFYFSSKLKMMISVLIYQCHVNFSKQLSLIRTPLDGFFWVFNIFR